MSTQKSIIKKIIGISLAGILSIIGTFGGYSIRVKADDWQQCTLNYEHDNRLSNILPANGTQYTGYYTASGTVDLRGENPWSATISDWYTFDAILSQGTNTRIHYYMLFSGICSVGNFTVKAKLPVPKNCAESSAVIYDPGSVTNYTTALSGRDDNDGYIIISQTETFTPEDARVTGNNENPTNIINCLVDFHMHYTLDYTYDATDHWKVCPTDNVIFNKEAHTFDESGYCFCGYKKGSLAPTDDQQSTTPDNTSDGSTQGTPAPTGSELKDSTGNAIGYKVLDDNKENPTVIYEGTDEDKTKDSINIPATVNDANGNTYKVVEIKADALKGSKSVKSVVIGENVEIIGDGAFDSCPNLKSVKLGKNVKKIGARAFRKCKKLTGASIPASVEQIGNNAFDGDSGLKKLTINCKGLKKFGKNAIRGIKSTATIKLKGTIKQKNAAVKKITNKKTGYKKTMKIKK